MGQVWPPFQHIVLMSCRRAHNWFISITVSYLTRRQSARCLLGEGFPSVGAQDGSGNRFPLWLGYQRRDSLGGFTEALLAPLAVRLRILTCWWLSVQLYGEADTSYSVEGDEGSHLDGTWKPSPTSHGPHKLATPAVCPRCSPLGHTLKYQHMSQLQRHFYFMFNRLFLKRLLFPPLVSCEIWDQFTQCDQAPGRGLWISTRLCSHKITYTTVQGNTADIAVLPYC